MSRRRPCHTGGDSLSFKEFALALWTFASLDINGIGRFTYEIYKNDQRDGIDVEEFGGLMMVSGLTLCEEVRWISFHSYFDFGYLVKVIFVSGTGSGAARDAGSRFRVESLGKSGDREIRIEGAWFCTSRRVLAMGIDRWRVLLSLFQSEPCTSSKPQL